MSMCFVIQPFDRGRFDKRFEDTFRPAIAAAGLHPYRVDQDPASVIPIEDIESGIRRADACFAEITTDNPNVWFELGYAIASRKPVVMVCAEERQRFPFDVQHRSIIRYKSDSPSDFDELGRRITERLKAALETQRELASIEDLSPIASTEGVSQHELVALISIAAATGVRGDPLHSFAVGQEMERAGYTEVATALALRALLRREFIEREQGWDGSHEYWGYTATDAGLDWLDQNREQLKLRRQEPKVDLSDDLPF